MNDGLGKSLNVVTVVGARPQFVKAAIVSKALKAAGISERIVHSGQHYDFAMSGQILNELGISIDGNLEVGSGSHAEQTADIMTRFAAYLLELESKPDVVVVYGDTNSTIAAALVAAKLQIPIAHIEAGLRSYNRGMPEEVNRVVTDHLSQILFCSSEEGRKNLQREGIRRNVHLTGDVMYDAFLHYSSGQVNGVNSWALRRADNADFVLMTLHRPSNTDDPTFLPRLKVILERIETPVVWPIHPRFRRAVDAIGLPDHVIRVDPVGYLEMLDLLNSCVHVITDSGGLQKEAYWAKRPCITLRSETEWVETLRGGWNVLASLDDDIVSLLKRVPDTVWGPLYGDGTASAEIARLLAEFSERAR